MTIQKLIKLTKQYHGNMFSYWNITFFGNFDQLQTWFLMTATCNDDIKVTHSSPCKDWHIHVFWDIHNWLSLLPTYAILKPLNLRNCTTANKQLRKGVLCLVLSLKLKQLLIKNGLFKTPLNWQDRRRYLKSVQFICSI